MNTKAKDETKPTNEIAVKPETNTDVMVYDDYGADAGAGMENVSSEEYKIPFITILQDLSKKCKPVERGGMEGAKPGMLWHGGTGELLTNADIEWFIPCYRERNYVGFMPIDAGGGFVGTYETDNPDIEALKAKQGKFGKLKRDPNNLKSEEIADTFYLYGLLKVKNASPSRVIIAFSTSKIPVYQTVIGRVDSIEYEVSDGSGGTKFVKPPMWAHTWNLGTVLESKKEKDYFNWALTLTGRDENGRQSPGESRIKMSDQRYKAAKEFNALLRDGKAKVDYGQAAEEDGTAQGGQPQGQRSSGPDVSDDEIPF